MTSRTKIRVGHSPDADDAFMFWGLASGRVSTNSEFEHILRDIQTLNEWAMNGELETTAVSVHTLAYVADRYAVLRHGGSFGEKYGPMLIAKEPLSVSDLKNKTIAIPGKLTSAYLQLCLIVDEPTVHVVPFDEIPQSVLSGKFDVGLIIHEAQLLWKDQGLHLVLDFGTWWHEQTGLPLPLGVNVVRKDLGQNTIQEINRAMRESIQAGLDHRREALEYAIQFGRGVPINTADSFVGMYVNQRTLDMGEDGIQAIKLLLKKGAERGVIPPVEPEFISA